MSIRISCPSCEASLTVDDEKAGKKIRCRKCEAVLTVPAAKRKREEEDSMQEGRKLRVKARSRQDDDDDDDDDDDRRPKKKSKKASSGAPVLLLALGGGGALLLLLLAGGGLGAWLLTRSPAQKQVNAAEPIAAVMPPPILNRPKPGGNNDPNAGNPKPPPAPKIPDPNAGKPLPDRMADDTIHRVKQATVYIRVTMSNGGVGTGSGFLAIEPELIVTNAHVVGMLQNNAQPPRMIEVFVNSGQPNELKMVGNLLGVDRGSDLAIIKVNNKNLPPPLPVDAERKLTELQKVYVFGFPFGEQLGKAITVSESAISSFRPDPKTNELDRIQVQGGMQPGNSGGPVVNAHGSVIGVAVSIIKGTQINFAIPAAKIHKVMEGRIADTRLDQAFVEAGTTKLPVKVVCLDPLRRINQLRLEVWTGMPGQPRPASPRQPPQLPGDGARQTHTVNYQGGIGNLDVPLPNAPPGQVFWVQPVITNAAGTQWGVATPSPVNLYPIERKPVNLTINYTTIKERTVKVKSSQGLGIQIANDYKKFANSMEVDLLESVSIEPSDPKLFRIRSIFGPTKLTIDAGDKSGSQRPPVIDLFRQIPPVHMVDGMNHFQKRVDRLLHPQLESRLREETQAAYAQLCNSVEALMVDMPNREVQPLENWQAKLPLMLRSGAGGPGPPPPPGAKIKPFVVDLALTCTYQGTRMRNQRTEGFITVTGRVQERDALAQQAGGEVTGRIGFDMQGGFISYGQLKINTVSNLNTPNGDLSTDNYFDIELTRAAGNTLNLQIPPETKGPAGSPPLVAKGKMLVNGLGVLLATDPIVPDPKFQAAQSRMKIQTVQLVAGKTYVITLDSNAFDAYLILQDPTGKTVAEDDDSGGGPPDHPLNARIEFRCTQTGQHRIIATSFDGKLGQFQLRVQEAQ